MKKLVTVLTGGVGGAKLVLGLSHAIPALDITAIVNVGDDFSHLGLAISPDVDTLLYTLGGKANVSQGWGREGETWGFMSALRSLGGEDWFNLGDGDLALHVLRTQRLRNGEPLSIIVKDFAAAWMIEAKILPVSNDRVRTRLNTEDGLLDFQDYFVRRRCEPMVKAIQFDDASHAQPAPGVIDAILNENCRAILIAPSNPFLSVDPILAVPGVKEALAAARAPVVAISPIVAGNAIKGPTTKLMRDLGIEVNAAAIATYYNGLIDGLLVDERDPPADIRIASARADTLMHTLDDRIRVARAALALADSLQQ
jgi:LPPG:FO 2-phospho-L-lactate transferase